MPSQLGDDVIDEYIILFWDKKKRVITGSDILERLLHAQEAGRSSQDGNRIG